MNTQQNIKRFETLMKEINREGIENLMDFIKKSDFYKAPSSTRFHLSTPGGLLQHSLNVYDAMMALCFDNGDSTYSYMVAGKEVAKISRESLIIMTLLHDLCKTYFYKLDYKNQKTYDANKVATADKQQVKHDNNGDFIWETVETYVVEDRIPYGHGEKSVMMIEEFVKLTSQERYAIRWHMGYTDVSQSQQYAIAEAFKLHPIAWALHNADMQASTFMEDDKDNKPNYQ